MGAFGCLLSCSTQARRQLASEITAQFEAFRATGLLLDHCQCPHKHFHLHPVVGALLVMIGRRFGLRAARVPLERRRLLLEIEPKTRWLFAPALIAPFVNLLRWRVRNAGLLTTDQIFGVEWSGRMTRDRLLHLIRNPAASTA